MVHLAHDWFQWLFPINMVTHRLYRAMTTVWWYSVLSFLAVFINCYIKLSDNGEQLKPQWDTKTCVSDFFIANGQTHYCGLFIKITVNGIPNHLNDSVMFTVYTQFTNLSSGSINTNWQAVGCRPMCYTLMKVWYSKLMHDG